MKCPGVNVHCPGCSGNTVKMITLIVIIFAAIIAYARRHLIETIAIDTLYAIAALLGLAIVTSGSLAIAMVLHGRRVKRNRIDAIDPVKHPNYVVSNTWQPINTNTQRIISNPLTVIEDDWMSKYSEEYKHDR